MNDHALPAFVTHVEQPPLVARALKNARLYAIDAGWSRRTPLRTHVVICGFPRAGTTLLGLMLQVAYPQARAFPRERAALRVAYHTHRNHRLMISKRPDDVFYLDALRSIYRYRRPSVRFLLAMRDPRAVLTSIHQTAKDRYYVAPERWRATYQHLHANRAQPDCLTIRFEDLVTDIRSIEKAIVEFVGEEPASPFDAFVDRVPAGFRATALNGVRALDPGAIDKWREPRHRDRISQMLHAIPDLPDTLVREGYETDTTWADSYLPTAETAEAR